MRDVHSSYYITNNSCAIMQNKVGAYDVRRTRFAWKMSSVRRALDAEIALG